MNKALQMLLGSKPKQSVAKTRNVTAMNDYNTEEDLLSRRLSPHIHIFPQPPLIELDSIAHQHIQLCGYLWSGFPPCELLRNVNTLTTVTGTTIYLGCVAHWCRVLCVCDAARR